MRYFRCSTRGAFCEKFYTTARGTNDNDAHACEPSHITMHNGQLNYLKKLLPVYKFLTIKIFMTFFFQWLGSNFLDYYVFPFLGYTDQFLGIGIIVVRPPG